MKKVILSIVTIFLLSFVSFSQSNDNSLIGKAKGAAHECLQNAPSGWQISGSTETIGICFVEGFITRVTLYAEFRCHSENCPKVAARLLATVDFDCEGNVISSTCY